MALTYATRLVARPDGDPSRQLEKAADRVASWAKIVDPLTDGRQEGRRGASVTTELLGAVDEEIWAWRLRLVHPDANDPAIMWAVSVACIRQADVEVSVRLDRTRTDATVSFARDRPAPPGCIAALLEADDLEFNDADAPLTNSVRVVAVEEAAAFAELVTHPDRRLPIFAFTPRDEDPIDGGMLLPQVLGLAHVALIRSETSWELDRHLPRGLNVYGGAARLWWPGVNRDSSRWDHRLWTADFRARRLQNAAVDLIVDAGITSAMQDRRLFELERRKRDQRTDQMVAELEELRAAAAAARRDTKPDGATAPAVAAVEARLQDAETKTIQALRSDRDVALSLAVAQEQEAAEARDRASLAERERDFLRSEVARLRQMGAVQAAQGEDHEPIVQEIEAEVDERGDVDGAVRRPFGLGPVFAINLQQHGDKYRPKIIKACADVVLGSVGLLARREDHSLRVGPGGNDPQRTRARDGAEARRCYIEHGTAAARRLHYWCLPDGSVEFASVNVHDDMTIPE